MTQRALAGLLAAILALLGAGCSHQHEPSGPHPPTAADIGFCQDMAVHHAQALLMAQQALAHASDPTVRAIATQILVSQSQERGTMTGWLTLWKAPQLPSGPPMTWMSDHRADPHGGHAMSSNPAPRAMPGMATQPELDQLATARGRDFDTLFLRLMLRHHAGGITMANHAKVYATAPEVRALAASMVLSQAEENAIMTQLLSQE